MRKALVISLIVVILLALGAAAFLVYRHYSHKNRVEDYKASVTSDWKAISTDAAELAAALDRVATPADLAAVNEKSTAFSDRIASISGRSQRAKAPGGYAVLSGKETETLKALKSYADMVAELSENPDESAIREKRGVLEYRAGKAKSDLSEFFAEAGFVKQDISDDFFRGGSSLEAAYAAPELAQAQDRQAAYDFVSSFMTADIDRQDFDYIWSVLSNRLHTGFDYYKVTKERMIENWPKAWGDHKPVAFFISKRDITFPDPDTALVKAIAYRDGAAPTIQEVRLVREADGWRMDGYPFVGWD